MLASQLSEPSKLSQNGIYSSSSRSEIGSISSSDKNTLLSSNTSTKSVYGDKQLVYTPQQNVPPLPFALEYSRFDQKEITIIRTTWCSTVAKVETEYSAANVNDKPFPKPTSSMFSSHHFWREVYEDLLEAHPELHNVLPSIKHQTISFSGIMYTAVMNLENLSVMNNFLENLGRRHSRVFGAEPVFFEYMGIAFINALAERFGDSFSPEVEAAWIKIYCFLSNSIIQYGYNADAVVMEDDQFEFSKLIDTSSSSQQQINRKKSIVIPTENDVSPTPSTFGNDVHHTLKKQPSNVDFKNSHSYNHQKTKKNLLFFKSRLSRHS